MKSVLSDAFASSPVEDRTVGIGDSTDAVLLTGTGSLPGDVERRRSAHDAVVLGVLCAQLPLKAFCFVHESNLALATTSPPVDVP